MLKQLRSLCCKVQPEFVFIGNDKIQDRDNNVYGKSVFFQFEGNPCPQGTQKRSGSIRRQKEGGKPGQSLRVASAGGTGEAELVSSKPV